jgi:ATP-dependent protease ClpP protease subunit
MWKGKRQRILKEEKDDSDDEDSPILKTYKNNVYYKGEIKEPEATIFCIKLRELSDQYHDTKESIMFHLTTHGGDIFAGLSMYEAIKHSKVPVHVIAESCVCSAGTIIMLGAEKRFMYPTSVILVHSLSSWMGGLQKPKEIREELQNSETLLDIMSEVYRNNTKLNKTHLKKLYDTDLYMRHDECVRLGFVDSVI